MTWHATGKCMEPGKMQHPVDGRAWKNFDTKYPDFAKEPKNVQLGLAADGFNSFGNLSQSCNMWPVILTTYNPWSRQGYKACPTCNEDTPSMRVLGKTTYVGHQRFLKKPHKWRRSLNFNGETEDGDPPRKFNRDQIMSQLARLPTFQKQIFSQTLMEDDMLKAQSKVVDILCNLELIYPPSFFNIMIHLVIHLPLEALEGRPIRLWWIRDECRITQNNGICSPGEKDGEMYYGQLEEILEFLYMSFKVVKQCFYLEDMARQPLGWKVVEHVSHTKFLNEGVIVVEDDPDVIHVDNSSDLALSTSLNDLEIAALHIDDQSIDVDAPPDIIDVVDEDDDIIDVEDPIPNDLAMIKTSLTSILLMMSADVARGHGDDGGGDDRPPTYQTQFDLRPHMESDRWPQIYAGIQQHLQKIYNGKKAALKERYWVPEEDGTYDLERLRRGRPSHISEVNWDAQLAFWNDPKNLARAAQNKQNRAKSKVMETSATREYPSLIHTFFLTHTVGGVFLNPEDKALYDEMLRLQGLGSNTPTGVPYTEDEIMAIVRGGKQRGHIPGVGRVLPGQGTVIPPPSQSTHSTDIARLKKREKQLTKQVNMFMRLFRSDDKFSQMLNQFESQPEYGGGSGSGGCGDDEPGDDEDGGEDEDDS
ncbi:S-adenosyl-L-methionine-dependent methyltransferases superfamily protein [Tanacetum coccineum]